MNLPIYPLPETFLILYAAVAIRLLLVSGAMQLAVQWWLGQSRQISPGVPRRMGAEIGNSLVASLFFAGAAAWIITRFHAGGTAIYTDPAKYGWAYLPLSFLLLISLHETYFYFTHRAMHHPRLFRWLHHTHHRSRNPTAFAAFSFHPGEAFLEALILPVLVSLVPVHYSVLALFLLFMSVVGGVNHLGYEIFPAGFSRHPLTRWWISPTHHQMHHELVGWNYGLYFNVWDRLLGTQHEGYEKRFEQVVGKRRAKRGPQGWDLVIAGGGLSGGLLAMCLNARRPEWRVLLLEKGNCVGGNHTWSFHGHDVPDAPWLSALVSKSWPRHEVLFPGLRRVLPSAYHSIQSRDFHAKVSLALGDRLRLNAEVKELGEDFVKLRSGEAIQAGAVIDARGAEPSLAAAGYQKFLGIDLELAAPHGLAHPVLMDASVPQLEGFRFFYLLPWSERELLVEDTRYSASSALDGEAFEAEIYSFCEARGWRVKNAKRTEIGVLPIPLAGVKADSGAIGMRGNIFHDTTGYSLPDNVRVAELLAGLSELNAETIRTALLDYHGRRRPSRSFLRALNRMLFLAASPGQRVKIFEKFYRLPLPTIQRFYRGELRLRDGFRILSGKPPVPVGMGLKAIFTRAREGEAL